MATERSPLTELAFPFMPGRPDRHGIVIEAARDWSFAAARVVGDPDVVVWGRLPDSGSAIGPAARSAVARELGLRLVRGRAPGRLRVAGVHRLGPHQLSSGLRGLLRATIRAGALVELTSLPRGERVLDGVVAAAGGRLARSRVRVGSGGALIARVEIDERPLALLRLARVGAPGDPAQLAEALGLLESLAVPLAPRLLRRGETAGASWTLEVALPGLPPARLTASLTTQVAAVLAGFPRADGPPSALADDLAGIAARLPDRADRVRALAVDLASTPPGLPAILRHGDMWARNLLIDHGRLSGIVDWDAAHRAGVAGSDLLQLVGTEMRRRARRSLGQGFLDLPWRSDEFVASAARYWRALGAAPTERDLETIGIAWWAAEIHGTLRRLPHRATDERWIAANVEPVLAALGYP